MATKASDRVEAALEPIAASHGYEVVAVELGGAKHRPVVRVFLDKEGGITLDEVAEANAWVGEAIDELGEPSGPYLLEVSSPGIERPLRKAADFQRFAGQRAEVRLMAPMEGRRQFTGTIETADGDAATLDVDGTRVRLPYDTMSRARLRVDIDFHDEGSGSKR
jgi:ribosome maturation factor RimP